MDSKQLPAGRISSVVSFCRLALVTSVRLTLKLGEESQCATFDAGRVTAA